jgi:putative membrane protein
MAVLAAVLAAAAEPWEFRAHPPVWVLLLGIIALGAYSVRVIGPKVVPSGMTIATTRQRSAFVVAVILMWVASDWPLHDIGENYLYSAHMVQHLLMAYVVAPLFLLATPRWLVDLLLADGSRIARAVLWVTRPVPAGVLFNAITILLHAPGVVRISVESGPMHYSMHLLLFVTSLLMWMPVCGPIEERRLTAPAKMLYLFLQSIVPTVPAGWLTFAENPVYKVYDREPRLWGIGILSDQQAAGAIMKIIGGFFLWAVIAVIFFRWASAEERKDRRVPIVRTPALPDDLTFERVNDTFERLGPAKPEPVPRGPDEIGDPRLN